jgi:hypothetical protein
MILEFGRENIAALCMFKMTLNGFNEDEIAQTFAEIEQGAEMQPQAQTSEQFL